MGIYFFSLSASGSVDDTQCNPERHVTETRVGNNCTFVFSSQSDFHEDADRLSQLALVALIVCLYSTPLTLIFLILRCIQVRRSRERNPDRKPGTVSVGP